MNNSPLRIESWPLERLVSESNPRTHSSDQIDQFAASIAELGFKNPILVDGDSTFIAGHARLLAARRLGLTQVPVVVLKHLTPLQKRAHVIADNRLALNAGWDEELLRSQLLALEQDGLDPQRTGFSDEELAATNPTNSLARQARSPPSNEIALRRRTSNVLLPYFCRTEFSDGP